MKKRIIVFSVITILWCGFIFYLSSENSAESSARSGRIVTSLCETFVTDFNELSETEKAEIISSVSFYVRKTAHFSAYAILGGLLFQVFCFVKDKRLRGLFSVAGSFAYAASDEFHQSFSPGRSCEFRDMLIDTGGALLAVLISLLVVYLTDRKKRQRL